MSSLVGRQLRWFAVASAALALTACAPGVACSAIGWRNTIEVRTIPAPGVVTSLRVCVKSNCVTGSTSSTDDPGRMQSLSVTSSGAGVWLIEVGMDSPNTVAITALDSAGEILGTKTAELRWNRVGGSERCGGPERTDPVELRIG